MTSTTPTTSHRRSASRGHTPSRPTTPLRPTSRSSFRGSSSSQHGGPHPSGSGTSNSSAPLEALEPQFAELSDSMADLEANMMHLQLMHESLARFSESFAAFLYGLNMNAFCVDFPEAPVGESFRRQRALEQAREAVLGGLAGQQQRAEREDAEATFLTTDTSFVENPPSSKQTSRFQTPAPSRVSNRGGGRGGAAAGRGRSGLPRGSGIARGRGRGRGGVR